MKEIKSMCESCHQPNQGGEGIEHDKGCPESDEQLTTNDNMTTTKKKTSIKDIAEHLPYDDSKEIAKAYLDLGITDEEEAKDIAEEIEEAYEGKWNSDEEFVRELLENTGCISKDIPWYVHIDWAWTAREVMMDYSEQHNYYFRNN
jgi:antirestriction protein